MEWRRASASAQEEEIVLFLDGVAYVDREGYRNAGLSVNLHKNGALIMLDPGGGPQDILSFRVNDIGAFSAKLNELARIAKILVLGSDGEVA